MATAPADRFASYDDVIRAIELASVEHLRPAGLWVRSMATLIDLLVATAAVGAVMGVIALVTRRGGGDWGGLVLLGYAAIGALLIARTGRTVGLWLFELEVVETATGQRPSLRRAAIRTLVPIALPLAGSIVNWGLQLAGHKHSKVAEAVSILSGCAPPVALLWASLRSHGKLTIWDRLSRTMVRYRTRRTTAI